MSDSIEAAKPPLDLSQPCNQAEFADLVGVSQQAVSEFMQRGMLGRGQTAITWLRAYTAHLREQAAGRGADGLLASNRAALTATQNERAQFELAKARREYLPVDMLAQTLATMGSRVASALEPLPAMIKMLAPEISPERLASIDAAITQARNIAAGVSLDLLSEDDAEEGGLAEEDEAELDE